MRNTLASHPLGTFGTCLGSQLVQAGTQLHRDALATDWELAERGEPLVGIEPLP